MPANLAGPALRGFTRAVAERDPASAVLELPPHLRAAGLRLLAQHAPLWQLREALEEAWIDGHTALVAGFTRGELLALFRRADFPLPGELPDPLRLWRGGAGRPPEELAQGIAWTRERDIAAAYAVRHSERFGGRPLLICRTVSRETVVFHDLSMGQGETLTDAPVAGVEVDPAPDLREAAARGEAAYRRYFEDLMQDPHAVLLHAGARRIAAMTARQHGFRL